LRLVSRVRRCPPAFNPPTLLWLCARHGVGCTCSAVHGSCRQLWRTTVSKGGGQGCSVRARGLIDRTRAGRVILFLTTRGQRGRLDYFRLSRTILHALSVYLQARCASRSGTGVSKANEGGKGLARTSLRRAPARRLGLSVRPYSDLLRPARTATIAHHEIRQ
jgi:hypothetical protein